MKKKRRKNENCTAQRVNKVKSNNLEFSWVSRCGALSGEVFQFQNDVSSTCTIILVEKTHFNFGEMRFISRQD